MCLYLQQLSAVRVPANALRHIKYANIISYIFFILFGGVRKSLKMFVYYIFKV